jgi:hypothetical protein
MKAVMNYERFLKIGTANVYPVRNNAPLLPPGQRPSLRGRSPSGAEPGPAAAAGLHFRIIPAGSNAPLEFLTGFTIIVYQTVFLEVSRGW